MKRKKDRKLNRRIKKKNNEATKNKECEQIVSKTERENERERELKKTNVDKETGNEGERKKECSLSIGAKMI